MSQTNFEKLEKDKIIELFNELFEEFYQKTDKWSELVIQEFITKDPDRLEHNIEKYLPDFDDDLAEMIRYQLFNNNAYLQYQKTDDLIFYLQNPSEIQEHFKNAYRFWVKERFDYNCRSCTAEANFLEDTLLTEINHTQKTFLCADCQETAPRGADGRKINQGKTEKSKVVRLKENEVVIIINLCDKHKKYLQEHIIRNPQIKDFTFLDQVKSAFYFNLKDTDKLILGSHFSGCCLPSYLSIK